MKKNGFTFIEILAMLVIIGIIMIVAVPNISGMIKNQRLDFYKHDAISMVESAKMKVKKEKTLVKPKEKDCIVFSLNYLDENDNIVTGPNGGTYDKFDSVVVYTRLGSKYVYYVRLVENYKGKRTGIQLVNSTEINSLKTMNITEMDDNIGLVKTDRSETALSKLSSFAEITSKCNIPIKAYYSGGNYCLVIENPHSENLYYDDEGNRVSKDVYEERCS